MKPITDEEASRLCEEGKAGILCDMGAVCPVNLPVVVQTIEGCFLFEYSEMKRNGVFIAPINCPYPLI